MKNKKEPEKKN